MVRRRDNTVEHIIDRYETGINLIYESGKIVKYEDSMRYIEKVKREEGQRKEKERQERIDDYKASIPPGKNLHQMTKAQHFSHTYKHP